MSVSNRARISLTEIFGSMGSSTIVSIRETDPELATLVRRVLFRMNGAFGVLSLCLTSSTEAEAPAAVAAVVAAAAEQDGELQLSVEQLALGVETATVLLSVFGAQSLTKCCGSNCR